MEAKIQMSGSNSVAIELLRTGTSYNHLLDPKQDYLALCGDYPAEEFQVNLQQYEFYKYLERLRYSARGASDSVQQTVDLQDIITKLFEGIPALLAQKVSHCEGWLHLRLIMAPRELAMLPFELSLTPIGFDHARTKPLLLNSDRPTTITREVRQVNPKQYHWPDKPRILFVWASPDKEVPADDHLIKLKASLLPWAPADKTTLEPDYSQLLTILPKASYTALQSAVKEAIDKPYTHIHILAHGIEIPDPYIGSQFGLALHQDIDPTAFADENLKPDSVNSGRLADALVYKQDDQTYTPAIITITACDSGNGGTNLVPGGSLAQVLHEKGVPYVLASQFPLSIPGSTQLLDVFYPPLLLGEDPRCTLADARTLLASTQSSTHDWASLVAYAWFPDNFDDQIQDVKLRIAMNLLRVANGWTDLLLNYKATDDETYNAVVNKLNVANRLEGTIARLESLLRQNEQVANNPARLAEHLGLLGSAYKRLAEYYERQSKRADAVQEALFIQSRTALEQARTYYQRGHDLVLTNHWTAVQYISLTAILQKTLLDEHDRWCVALFAAEKDWYNTHGQDQVWAGGTLAELYLLKPFTVKAEEFEAEKTKALEKATFYLDEIAKSNYDFAKESTARQLERYMRWWPIAFPSAITAQLKTMAEQLIEHLPPLADKP